MKLTELFSQDRFSLSFEVSPPKTTSTFDSVRETTEKIAAMGADFMSVTYGAGGQRDSYTLDIAGNLKRKYGVSQAVHLTCVGTRAEDVDAAMVKLRENGVENILALRGDIPKDTEETKWDFMHASDLIAYIKGHGDFCVGGACYPEGHLESKNQKEDIDYLRLKEEKGCEFFISQMFFDNNIMYNFLYKARSAGVTIPVVAGIIPVTNGKQIKRICALSGTELPARFKQIADKFGDKPAAMKQAGIAYATEQIVDLYANGVKHVHVYSMNKADVAAAIKNNLKDILEYGNS